MKGDNEPSVLSNSTSNVCTFSDDNDDELKGMPICIITGKPELRKLIYERAVRPPEGYVDKPVNEEHLLLNVRKILEKHKKTHTE